MLRVTGLLVGLGMIAIAYAQIEQPLTHNPNAGSSRAEESWEKIYDGTLSGWDQGEDITTDGSGNIFVTGITEGSAALSDIITIKYSATGVEQWTATYNGPGDGNDQPSKILVDSDGNVIVGGESKGLDLNLDFILIKYGPSGTMLWESRYSGDGNGHDGIKDMELDILGNIYVTGYSAGDGTMSDYATIKYDSNGNQLWVVRFNGTSDQTDSPNALDVDTNGNVCVTGVSYLSTYISDYATIKYNASGATLWTKIYGGPDGQWDHGEDVAIDADGNVYVTGYSNYTASGDDYTTIKYGLDGTPHWVRTYNGTGNSIDQATDLAIDSGGDILVSGYSYGAGSDRDYLTIKYDSSGAELWSVRYDGSGSGDDTPSAIALDMSDNVYVTGTSLGYDSYDDYTTIKYLSDGTEEWVARYDGTDNDDDGASAIAISPDGSISITGESYSYSSEDDIVTIKYIETSPRDIIIPMEYPTIQAGIDAAYDGDRVLVNPGVYNEMIDFGGKAIWVKSLAGPEATAIDGSGLLKSLVTFSNAEGKESVLDGFTIRNGEGKSWSGATSGEAAGIYCSGASPTLKNLIIQSNVGEGSAMWITAYSSPVIENILIHSNTGESVILIDRSRPSFIHASIVNNQISEAAVNVKLLSLTTLKHSNVSFINSLLWNTGSELMNEVYAPDTIVFHSSNVEGGVEGFVRDTYDDGASIDWVNGLDVEPFLVDMSRNNYALSDGSPCIGAGLDTIVVPAHDLTGNPRPDPVGSMPDIGAIEHILSAPVLNQPPVAVNDTSYLSEDEMITIDVLLNDSDPEDDLLSIHSLDLTATLGTVAIDAEQQLINYSPPANYFGDDIFSYGVSDGQAIDTASVILFISSVNDPPDPFILTSPSDSSLLEYWGGRQMEFKWEPSHDEDGDTIRYRIQFISGTSWQFTDSSTTTRYVADLATFPLAEWIQWEVFAMDQESERRSEESFTFNILQVVGIEGQLGIPSDFALDPNFPNPFNPVTNIRYDVPDQSHIKLTIHDVRGQEVRLLIDSEKDPGSYSVQWNGVDQAGEAVSTGIYFARLQAETYNGTIKMLYLK